MNDVVAEGCGAALFVSHNDGEVATIAQAFGEVGVSVLGAAGASERSQRVERRVGCWE